MSDWHEQLPKTPGVYNNYTLALERMHLGAVYQKKLFAFTKGSQTGLFQNYSFTNRTEWFVFEKWKQWFIYKLDRNLFRNLEKEFVYILFSRWTDQFVQQIRMNESFTNQTEQFCHKPDWRNRSLIRLNKSLLIDLNGN